jgi:hypothetical protein
MLSSISNSDSTKWIKSWILLIILLVVTLGTYESHLKALGHRHSIASDVNLWSYYRDMANKNSETLVILGASRAQLGLDMNTIKTKFPEKDVIQLTVNGQFPMLTLEEMANDPDFTGDIWLSIVAQSLEPVYWDMQQEYNQHFKESSTTYKQLEAVIKANIQYQFRFLHSELQLQKVIDHYQKHGVFPIPLYVAENPDLSKSGDYSKQNSDHLVNHFVTQKAQNYKNQPPMDVKDFDQMVSRFNTAVERIRSKGGNIWVIRMPTDKGHWDLDERFYPKTMYWDRITEQVNAGFIHFIDHASLREFDLPDSSHLDQTDAPIFTENLIKIMNQINN